MLKRTFDILAALVAFFFLAPLFLILAILIRTRLGSPVLFRQPRPGLHGRTFQLVKFRSMTNECAADGSLLPDEARLNAFGRWLRSTSLDEIPEIWNVLRGDMSLVGPRPLLVDYLPRYSPRQARRHEVRPGVTGWAQVNGRNALTWPEKFELDVWYVDNRSFQLDIYILFLTLRSVVKRDGINAAGEATMPAFRGDEE